jgi:hypothetical protein
MEGATDLSELLGGQPVQSPAFQPMVTGGGDPFSTPLNTNNAPKEKFTDYSRQFSIIRGSVRGMLGYLAFFLAAVMVHMPITVSIRDKILSLVSGSRGEGGVLSYLGSAVLAAVTVVLAFVINTVIHTLV